MSYNEVEQLKFPEKRVQCMILLACTVLGERACTCAIQCVRRDRDYKGYFEHNMQQNTWYPCTAKYAAAFTGTQKSLTKETTSIVRPVAR